MTQRKPFDPYMYVFQTSKRKLRKQVRSHFFDEVRSRFFDFATMVVLLLALFSLGFACGRITF